MATYGIVPPRDVNLPAAVTDGAPFMLLFHATSNPDKKWPANHWAALATQMMARGLRVLLPWGSAAEHDDAQDIAARAPGSVVLPAMTVRELGAALGRAALVVGVDTGFVHMAHALQRPTVMIFVATSRHHCGIGGAPNALSIGEPGMMPSVDEALDAIGTVSPAYGALRADDRLTKRGVPVQASSASTVTTAATAARFASSASNTRPRQSAAGSASRAGSRHPARARGSGRDRHCRGGCSWRRLLRGGIPGAQRRTQDRV